MCSIYVCFPLHMVKFHLLVHFELVNCILISLISILKCNAVTFNSNKNTVTLRFSKKWNCQGSKIKYWPKNKQRLRSDQIHSMDSLKRIKQMVVRHFKQKYPWHLTFCLLVDSIFLDSILPNFLSINSFWPFIFMVYFYVHKPRRAEGRSGRSGAFSFCEQFLFIMGPNYWSNEQSNPLVFEYSWP